MMSRFCKGLICLIVTVAGAIESRADIPNLRIRDVAPDVAFPGVEQHADHVFLIHLEEGSRRVTGPHSTQRVIPIAGPEAFPFRAGNVVRMSISTWSGSLSRNCGTKPQPLESQPGVT